MWWAAADLGMQQAIQDRWCSGRLARMDLIQPFWVYLKMQPTQMAIPLHTELDS